MAKMNVKVIGIKATQAYLISKILKINKGTEKGMEEIGKFLKEEVKASINGKRGELKSVDTGEFRDSVNAVNSKDSATVFSEVKQAKPLEYGTSKITARKHFNNSKDSNKSKIVDIIKKNITLGN